MLVLKKRSDMKYTENQPEKMWFSKDETIIGRNPTSDYILDSSLRPKMISRKHCIVKKEDDDYVMHMFGLNGAVINDKCIPKGATHTLKHGDKVAFGVVPPNKKANEKAVIQPAKTQLTYTFVVQAKENTKSLKRRRSNENVNSSGDNKRTKSAESSESFVTPAKIIDLTEDTVPLNDPDTLDSKQIDEQREILACSTCCDICILPYLLQCGHNFCLECITQWIEKKANNGLVTCPICREEIKELSPAISYGQLALTVLKADEKTDYNDRLVEAKKKQDEWLRSCVNILGKEKQNKEAKVPPIIINNTRHRRGPNIRGGRGGRGGGTFNIIRGLAQAQRRRYNNNNNNNRAYYIP